MKTRRTIVWALVAVALLGPASPWAIAQQPPPASNEVTVTEVVPLYPPPRRTDVYDMGAAAMTAVRIPGNIITCGVGAVAGTILLLVTFGSAHKETARVFEEGCGQRWIVRGEDIRPHGPLGFFDRSERYGAPRR
jgi:hypothetical protein